MNLTVIYRSIVPLKYRHFFHVGYYVGRITEYFYIKTIRSKHEKALRRLKGRKTYKCLFMALFDSVWKYDKVYQLMAENPLFEPIIMVCPVVNYGRENMLDRMEATYHYFIQKGYHVIKSYSENTDTYIDIRREICPDIIFYTNPYDDLIDKRYHITSYRDFLTVYVPYSINNSVEYKGNYDLIIHNLVWRHYLPSQYHLDYSLKYARNRGVNSVMTGFPGIESLIDHHIPSDSAWKIKSAPKMKRIIWAPHHTIEPVGTVYYSCFLRYCEFMIHLAQKYQDSVQFVFKPHPLLKNKLELSWGKEKTDDYYSRWQLMPNTNIHESDYEDLFLTSDAMIHDSGSFIGEYLYVNKPVMRTLNEVDESEKMNGFAMECISNHYLAYEEADIEQFIQNIINDVDPLKEKRTKFVEEVLMPKGSPSVNLCNDILSSIEHQTLYHR